MKHLKGMKTYIISLFALLIFATQTIGASAYTSTSDTYYPIVVDSARLTVTNTSAVQSYSNGFSSYQDGKYYYDNAALTKVDWIHWYPGKSGSTEWTFVFQPDLYDYYLIGTLTASTSSDTGSTFKPTQIEVAYRSVDSKADLLYSVSDTNIYNIDNSYYKGFGFSTKVDFASAGNTGISYIAMIEDKDGSGKQPAALAFEAGILAVEKESSEADVLSKILNQLVEMQEETVTAIEAHSTKMGSWFNSLYSGMSSWFSQQNEKLQTWFSDVTEQNQQIHEEEAAQSSEQHEEVLHGYDTTVESNINADLSNNLNALETAEQQLTDTAFSGMNEYTIAEDVTSYNAMLLTTIPMVAAMMQSIFDSSGDFGILISVIFTLTIVCMVIGLYRYRKD